MRWVLCTILFATFPFFAVAQETQPTEPSPAHALEVRAVSAFVNATILAQRARDAQAADLTGEELGVLDAHVEAEILHLAQFFHFAMEALEDVHEWQAFLGRVEAFLGENESFLGGTPEEQEILREAERLRRFFGEDDGEPLTMEDVTRFLGQSYGQGETGPPSHPWGDMLQTAEEYVRHLEAHVAARQEGRDLQREESDALLQQILEGTGDLLEGGAP